MSLIALSVFIPRLLPMVDYPQHLALADVARRLFDPASAEQGTHLLNPATYNGLFHLIVAALSYVLPIELTGKIVVAGSYVLTGYAVRALLSATNRPTLYTFLYLPVVFSFSAAWGFVNFVLGTALALTTCRWIALLASADRPSRKHWLLAVLFGQLCAMTHVLAMLLLCLFSSALAINLAFKDGLFSARRHIATVRRVFVALSPLLLGSLYCVGVFLVQYAWDPPAYSDPTMEGSSPPFWQKLVWFGSFANGALGDRTDQVLLWLSLAIAVYCLRRRFLLATDTGRVYLPLVAMFLAYLLTPAVFIGTHLIFPRIAPWVLLGLLFALPSQPASIPAVRKTALAIGMLTGLNLVVHNIQFARETDDASRVIDSLAPGRAATAVLYQPTTWAYRQSPLIHLAAYYGARKHGDWAFSFARYLSVPVRFRRGAALPAYPPKGWEFSPHHYAPCSVYAQHFSLVIVRGLPGDTEITLRNRLFGTDPRLVRAPNQLAHFGDYWAFDVKGTCNPS